MTSIQLKICGLKHNVEEVLALQPDYVGFIFYEKSKRNYDKTPFINLPETVKRVGVFVDASINEIVEKILEHSLNIIQLHGSESSDYCIKLKQAVSKMNGNPVAIWKVFSVGERFNFALLLPYEHCVEAYLFDTKGKEKGGNGFTFNWELLQQYNSKTPFILSGGIGLEHIPTLKKMSESSLPLLAIDVNSKFEISPGLKDISRLKKLVNQLGMKPSR